MKAGPLTAADLRAIWEGAADEAYTQPLLAAGDGAGLEVHSQLWEQLERASRAIDVTTQAMFVLPWSGQTAPPAQGEAKATVGLSLRRAGSAMSDRLVVLGGGDFLVGEATTDWGDDGGVEVETGRRYALRAPAVFFPAYCGPVLADADAERPGYGYNNPLPGTITAIDQVGSGLNGTLGTVTTALGQFAALVTADALDQVVPENVGQYLRFTAGSNAGRVVRVVDFIPPTTGAGSGAYLDQTWAGQGTTFAGTFVAGEVVTFSAGSAAGVVLGELVDGAAKRLAVSIRSGTFASVVPGTVATGASSGATLTVAVVDALEVLVPEVATASWRVLDWAAELGITATNPESPEGGRAGMLDELGADRNVDRSPGESDDDYRQRVATVADVVSPNAIRRAVARAMGPIPWCFREVGLASLRGFFFDGDATGVGGAKAASTAAASRFDAYDTDVIVFTGSVSSGAFRFQEPVVLRDAAGNVSARGRLGTDALPLTASLVLVRQDGAAPASLAGLTLVGLESGAVFAPSTAAVPTSVAARRNRTLFDLQHFRAYFRIGVPPLPTGEFGMAYDSGVANAYDLAGSVLYPSFYDGFPAGAGAFYRALYQAIDPVRAGGVEFDIYPETIGCDS